MKQVLCLTSLIQEEDMALPVSSDAVAKPVDLTAVKEQDLDLILPGTFPLQEMPQKNTFIHYDIHCERPPTPTSSAPGALLSRLFKTKTKADSEELAMQSSLSTESVLSSLADTSTTSNGDFENDSQASTSTAGSTGSPVVGQVEFALDNQAKAEELHLHGQCTPCNYYWYKADGCRMGSTCEFCHLCPKGEIKKRKKDKLRQLQRYGQSHIGTRKARLRNARRTN